MMNHENQNNNGEDKSFAELLESYSPDMNTEIRTGDKIRGRIISIGESAVFVDTGSKIDGAVDKAELLDENKELPFHEGDELELYVVSADESEIRLSRAISGAGGLNLLRDAHKGGVPVEGKVLSTCKGGFRVEVLKKKAFCPVSQMDLVFVENPEEYVGQTHEFLISRIEENGRNIVVSRRKLLDLELEKIRTAFYDTLETGDTYDGRVTRVMPYGAFVEISRGVEGMVHISELSWSRLATTEEAARPGDVIRVLVTGIETDEKSGRKKIALSAKQVDGNPWERVTENFRAGEKVKGKVTQCMAYGAFVEIAPGIEGLVHISEMSYTQRVMKPEDIVQPGETISVMIKDISPDEKRITLSLRDAEGDPWMDVPDKYKIGQVVNGKIEKKEKFGYFITLEPGITGLLPKSKISRSGSASQIEKLKEGGSITVMVDEIKAADRKITLGPGDANEEGDWQEFAAAPANTMGALGEKLQAAINKNDKKGK